MSGVFSCRVCSHVGCVLMSGVFSCQVCSHVECVLMSGVFSCRVCSHVRCVLMSGVFACQVCFHVRCSPGVSLTSSWSSTFSVLAVTVDGGIAQYLFCIASYHTGGRGGW